jgi:hypothetical protein
MLLQVERVVLNALGKNTALAADICASRESLAIVFRTSRSTMANKEQCPPMCTERKNLRLGVAVLAAASTGSGVRRGERLYNNVQRFTVRLSCERRSCWNFFVGPLSSIARSRRRVGRRFRVR